MHVWTVFYCFYSILGIILLLVQKKKNMLAKIHTKDLQILCALFLNKTTPIQVEDNLKQLGGFKVNGKRQHPAEFAQLVLGSESKPPKSPINYDRILEFGDTLKSEHIYQHQMRYIMVHGNMRWVYPKGEISKVLKFYHASTFRAKILKLGLRLLGACKLDRWVSHPLTLHTDMKQCFQKGPKEINFDAFTIFMGTPGIERSVLVGMYQKNHCNSLMKVGMNSLSLRNMENEGNFLYKLQQKNWQYVNLPQLMHRNRDALVFSRLHAKDQKATHQFTKLHANAFLEITNTSRSLQQFESSSFGEQILDNCAFIERNSKSKSPLEKSLLEAVDKIPANLHFSAALAHGDFTPWNMFVTKSQLHVYDWEAAMHYAPLLYDLIHYHFQTGIFVKKWSFQKIYSQIKFSIESNEDVRKLVHRHVVDLKMHVHLYLLHLVSRKCVHNLLVPEVSDTTLQHRNKVWEEAMRYVAPTTHCQRTSFMLTLKAFLEDATHAFLKFNANQLEELPVGSDLDIAIAKSAVKEVVQYCKEQPTVRRVRVLKKSFMSTVEVFFQDNQYLSIDLIHDFKRRATRFMEMEDLLQNRERNQQGIWVPALKHDVEYTLLFYTLNGADVPVKYLEFFTGKCIADQSETIQYFEEKYALRFSNLGSLMSATEICANAFKKCLSVYKKKHVWSQISLIVNYGVDTLRDRTLRRGFIVTFSGVDGVGKTTIIENVSEKLRTKYRKEVVLLRQRPKMLPMLSSFKYGSNTKAEEHSDSDNPNHVTEKSTVSSYLRFAYYYLDYFFGQFYIHLRYVVPGKVVIYDRYYFDLINHSERNNFVVNRKLVKWLYRPIIKPALNIYLNAAPDEIFRRKRELDIHEIETLSNKYVTLFSEYAKHQNEPRYVIHRNEEVAKTVEEILYDVQQIA